MSNNPNNQLSLIDGALSLEQMVNQRKRIEDVFSKLMTKDQHYGTIPGCGKQPTLLQPGAQFTDPSA